MKLAALGVVLTACSGNPAHVPPIRFLHTFGPEETELFNAVIAERGMAIESSLVPFARGQQVISEILRAATACPDLIRIDATWLPGLVESKLVVAAPLQLSSLDWTPEGAALAQMHGVWWGLPQAVDGLIVVRDAATPAPASPAIDDLLAATRATQSGARHYPLGLRVDGYWLIPWLRAEGAELVAPSGVAGDGATRAITRFAALFGDVAPPPPPSGSEAPDELRRWNAHEVAYWITGPWQLATLADRDHIAVSALARAPRGGQLLVVPKCAKHPDDGWRLAEELTSLTAQARFAATFATIPTRRAALEDAPALSRAAYQALASAEMLPRAPETPLLFDDLNPALAAVVFGDATADEAIVGVRRGWQRLTEHEPPHEKAGAP